MWVIKLGGSLVGYAGLERWLKLIAASTQAIVIVPGGGPLANAVRYAQQEYDFDDGVAHQLALLAMDRTAEFVSRLNNCLEPCWNRQAIQQALNRNKVPVWMPAQEVLADKAIQRDWTVTSDSLAVWLATGLQASGLLLVKSCAINRELKKPSELSFEGVVDQSFPRMVDDINYPVFLMMRDHYRQLDALFAGEYTEAIQLET